MLMRLTAVGFLSLTACGPPEWVRANAGAEVGFSGVHGSGPNDVWAVGELGTIAHYDGTGWKVATPITSVTLRAVAAVSTTDAWAFGDSGTALHWDGKAWARVDMGTSNDIISAVALAANDVWALPKDQRYLWRWNGTVFAKVDATTRNDGYGKCLGGNSANNLWLMPGSTSHAYLVTPSGLAEIALDISGSFDCIGISAQSLDDAWFLADDKVLHFDGRLFRPSAPPQELLSSFYARAIFASARNQAWVVGSGGGIYRVEGVTWTVSSPFAYSTPHYNAVWGAHVDDLWSVGTLGVVSHHSTPRPAP